MNLPATPPTPEESNRVLKLGSTGWPVYALQSALNDAAGASLTKDGMFGFHTERAVEEFQRSAGITPDGIAGPLTRRKLAAAVSRRIQRDLEDLPDGLAARFAQAEGGSNLAAVNWNAPGGVDVGLFQQRISGPPFRESDLQQAFAPYRSGYRVMERLVDRAADYAKPHPRSPFSPMQLAVLAHNWPWAAEQYYRYGKLPDGDKRAEWVPSSLPAEAQTYDGWARFYVKMVMGA